MSLLNVTRISISPGATSLVPASGTFFTTTGAMESMSCARAVAAPTAQSAPAMRIATNVFVFMCLFLSVLVWFGLENQQIRHRWPTGPVGEILELLRVE